MKRSEVEYTSRQGIFHKRLAECVIIGLILFEIIGCKEEGQLPELSTMDVSDITQTTAITGGNITSDEGSSVTSRGVCWGVSSKPTIADSKTSNGKGTGEFYVMVTGLMPDTRYYLRAYASSSEGTGYGNEITFVTLPVELPTLTTSAVTNILSRSAIAGGFISFDGGSDIIARGVCWETSQNPTTLGSKTMDGTGIGGFTSSISDLNPGTLYYLRAYATNDLGTSYGNEISFCTLVESTETVTDIDGNVYHVVTIGTQDWMVENLKVTKYQNGDPIPNVTQLSAWAVLNTGAYCNMLNDANQAVIFGRLYNWYAVDDSRDIAPAGWHVPTDNDWTVLETYLGGASVAGGKMKEQGTVYWCDPNVGATNESGFTARPGGVRSHLYDFIPGCDWGFWWSSTKCTDSTAYNRIIFNNETVINRVDNLIKSGFSVRCIKD